MKMKMFKYVTEFPEDYAEYRFCHFPLHSNAGTQSFDDNHWTLLMFDRCTGDWMFNNSLRPDKKQVDPYVENAKRMVSIKFTSI